MKAFQFTGAPLDHGRPPRARCGGGATVPGHRRREAGPGRPGPRRRRRPRPIDPVLAASCTS